MARPRKILPEKRSHISGQDRVDLDGRYFYLGPCGSIEAQTRYETLLGLDLSNGRKIPKEEPTHQAETVIKVAHVAAEYRRLIEQRIKKMFKHAMSRELIPLEVYSHLETLDPLSYGQTTAKEYKQRMPVSIAIVNATAKFLSPQAKAIITLQAATGMRPSEIFEMRPCDIDRSGNEWFYRPTHHKTADHGVTKAVPIVGAAKTALMPFLLRPAVAFCFSPAESARGIVTSERLTERRPRSRATASAPTAKQTQSACRRSRLQEGDCEVSCTFAKPVGQKRMLS